MGDWKYKFHVVSTSEVDNFFSFEYIILLSNQPTICIQQDAAFTAVTHTKIKSQQILIVPTTQIQNYTVP